MNTCLGYSFKRACIAINVCPINAARLKVKSCFEFVVNSCVNVTFNTKAWKSIKTTVNVPMTSAFKGSFSPCTGVIVSPDNAKETLTVNNSFCYKVADFSLLG